MVSKDGRADKAVRRLDMLAVQSNVNTCSQIEGPQSEIRTRKEKQVGKLEIEIV